MDASLVDCTVRQRLGGFDDQWMREPTGGSSDHAVLRSPLELDLRWLVGYRFVILFSAGPNGNPVQLWVIGQRRSGHRLSLTNSGPVTSRRHWNVVSLTQLAQTPVRQSELLSNGYDRSRPYQVIEFATAQHPLFIGAPRAMLVILVHSASAFLHLSLPADGYYA